MEAQFSEFSSVLFWIQTLIFVVIIVFFVALFYLVKNFRNSKTKISELEKRIEILEKDKI